MTKQCPTCNSFISQDDEYCSKKCSNGLAPKQIIRECKNCDSDIVTTKNEDKKFCNIDCLRIYEDEELTKRTTCPVCEKEFQEPKSVNSTYCSRDCMSKDYSDERFSNSNHPHYDGGKLSKTCEFCEKKFKVWPKRNNAKYCSVKCMSKDYKGKRTGEDHPNYDSYNLKCDWCGSNLVRKNVHFQKYENHFCNQKCQGKWISENKVGSNAYNWKGGTVEYYGFNWTKQRIKALERDDYSCRICGKGKNEIGRNPSVHHIKPIRKFEKKQIANKLKNLVCLCPSHHHKIEGWNMVPANIKE